MTPKEKGIKATAPTQLLCLNFEGGKIKDSRHYFDMLSLPQQLGVIPC
jgi:hypothetical protein